MKQLLAAVLLTACAYATAETFATIHSRAGRVVLTDDREGCPPDTAVATRGALRGCYRVRGVHIEVRYTNGNEAVYRLADARLSEAYRQKLRPEN